MKYNKKVSAWMNKYKCDEGWSMKTAWSSEWCAVRGGGASGTQVRRILPHPRLTLQTHINVISLKFIHSWSLVIQQSTCIFVSNGQIFRLVFYTMYSYLHNVKTYCFCTHHIFSRIRKTRRSKREQGQSNFCVKTLKFFLLIVRNRS